MLPVGEKRRRLLRSLTGGYPDEERFESGQGRDRHEMQDTWLRQERNTGVLHRLSGEFGKERKVTWTLFGMAQWGR